MSEEINTEELETVVEESLTEEKSLEDQIAALEEVASLIETDVEEKVVEEEAEVKSEDETEETEVKSEEKAEESEEVKDAVEGENDEEKASAHPVATGYPYDAVVLQPGKPEFDEEEDEKTQVPKKRQIVVVEMDPDEVTEDMKAYVVEVDDDEEDDEEVSILDEEEKPYHDGDEKRRMRVPLPDDDEDAPGPLPAPDAVAPLPADAPPRPGPPPGPPAAPPRPAVPPGAAVPVDGPPQANPRLARLLEQARNGPPPEGGPPGLPPTPPDDEDEEEARRRRFKPATMVGRKEDEPASVKDLLDQDALSDRLTRMGMSKREQSELGDDDFLCAIERKVLSGDVCNFCRGGCASEKGLPGLLEIEVMAEKEFEGHVVDSGYAPKDDIFVLDLKTDRGPIETYYSGAGATLGWIALAENIEEKSAGNEGMHIVSFAEAEMIALQNCKGESLGVDADLFQGEDAYVVEINGKDGKSYDAYVSVDGNFLGTDMIELTDEEEEEIKELMLEKAALEAEVRIKRVYTTERAAELVSQGMALKGGRFPIVTHQDLENAILAAGRVKDDIEVREHIAKRAEEMEKTDLLPENWDAKSAAEEAEFVASLMELQMLEAEFPSEE